MLSASPAGTFSRLRTPDIPRPPRTGAHTGLRASAGRQVLGLALWGNPSPSPAYGTARAWIHAPDMLLPHAQVPTGPTRRKTQLARSHRGPWPDTACAESGAAASVRTAAEQRKWSLLTEPHTLVTAPHGRTLKPSRVKAGQSHLCMGPSHHYAPQSCLQR